MATTYQWVRHVGSPTPYGGITDAVANKFGAYTSDNYFGTRTIISPVPTTVNKDFQWRSKVTRVGVQLLDIEWKYRTDGTTESLHARTYSSGVPGTWQDQTAQLSGMPSNTLVLDSVFSAASAFGSIAAEDVEDIFTGTTVAERVSQAVWNLGR